MEQNIGNVTYPHRECPERRAVIIPEQEPGEDQYSAYRDRGAALTETGGRTRYRQIDSRCAALTETGGRTRYPQIGVVLGCRHIRMPTRYYAMLHIILDT